MPDPDNDIYALIAHPYAPHALLLSAGEAGWALPRLPSDDAAEIRASVRAATGLETTVLGILSDDSDVESDDLRLILALECHSAPEGAAATARWLDRAALAALPLAHATHHKTLETWLREVETGDIPPRRAPWMRLGWYAGAVAWIDAELARLGMRRAGDVEQVKVRAWSHVLRAPVEGSAPLYFKATAAAFAHEPRLTAALAAYDAAALPSVLALDADRGWLLLADAGETIRDRVVEQHDLALWQHALRRYARLQMATAGHADALAALGCPDRRLARIPTLYAEFVADLPALRPGTPEDIGDDDLARLRAFAPEVARLCDQLAAVGLPATIHHDDLGPGNIHERAGEFTVIDWGEAALALPFCSLMIPLHWAALVMNCSAAELAALRDAYLEEWTVYGTLERLREAAALAIRLGYLSRALTWRAFMASVEPAAGRPHRDAPPYWLKLFLNDGRE